MSEHGSQNGGCPGGYETSDVSARSMARWAIGLFAFVVLSMVLMLGYYVALHGPVGGRARATAREQRLPPWPRLQANPAKDLVTYEREQQALTDSYAWIDKPRGIVRLPVYRAMELVLERGLPDWKPVAKTRGDLR